MTHESQNDEWDDDLRARLESLPMERVPSSGMKQRTMNAARAAGHVRTGSRSRVSRTVMLLAAASLIFAAGTLLGYALATRATRASQPAPATFARGFTINSDPTRHVVWY